MTQNISEPTAPCVDCGKQVTLHDIEFGREICPDNPPSENGIEWGHRVSRNDYEAVLGGRI